MQRMYCPNHGPAPDFQQWLGPLAAASSVGVLASHVSKGNPYVTLAGAFLGLLTGAEAAKHCIYCGELLQIVDDINPLFS
jgi:hypothetical protein